MGPVLCMLLHQTSIQSEMKVASQFLALYMHSKFSCGIMIIYSDQNFLQACLEWCRILLHFLKPFPFAVTSKSPKKSQTSFDLLMSTCKGLCCASIGRTLLKNDMELRNYYKRIHIQPLTLSQNRAIQ